MSPEAITARKVSPSDRTSTATRSAQTSNSALPNGLKIGTNTLLNYQDIEQADDGEYSVVTPISAARFMLPYWNPLPSRRLARPR